MKGDQGNRPDLFPPPSAIFGIPELRAERASKAFIALEQIYPSLERFSVLLTTGGIPGDGEIDSKILRELLEASGHVRRGNWSNARVSFTLAHNIFARIFDMGDEDVQFGVGSQEVRGSFSRNQLAALATASDEELAKLRRRLEILPRSSERR